MNGPYYDRHGVTVHAGDCLDVLRCLPDASVHAVICDPPYGLADIRPAQATAALTAWANGDREHVPNGRGFMGRDWDAFVPPPAVWDECLRVLTPGGHLAAFAGSRSYDLMGLSIRMAGFEIRDGLQWLYGSGMPKGMDLSKAIDKAGGGSPVEHGRILRIARERAGMTRQDVAAAIGCKPQSVGDWEDGRSRAVGEPREVCVPSITYREKLADLLGYTPEERREVIGQGKSGAAVVAFARDEPGSYNVTTPATDAAREWSGWNTALKPAHEPIVLARKPLSGTVAATVLAHGTGALHVDACRTGGVEGRWPANVLLDEGAAAELDEQSGTLKSGNRKAGEYGLMGYMGDDAAPMPEAVGDSGGASRFFPVFRWEAKASTLERPQVDGVAHPTVKPLAVMRWLVRLLTPPGGLVLDPFAGSGTTLHAARAEGFRAIGIEREPSYLPLIKARLDARPRAASETQTATDNEPMDLLDLLTEDGAA